MNIEQDQKIISDIVERYKDYIREFVKCNGYRYTLRKGVINKSLDKVLNDKSIGTDTVVKMYQNILSNNSDKP